MRGLRKKNHRQVLPQSLRAFLARRLPKMRMLRLQVSGLSFAPKLSCLFLIFGLDYQKSKENPQNTGHLKKKSSFFLRILYL